MISASYLFVNELRDCFIISVGMTSKQHDFDLQIIIILLGITLRGSEILKPLLV